VKKSPVDIERLLGRLFLIGLSSLLAFMAVEGISRKFLHPEVALIEKQYTAKNIRRPRPYIMFKGTPHAKAWKIKYVKSGLGDRVLNDLGYPGQAPVMPKPPGEFRIIVVGGSAAFMGYPAIPRLIQYQFEKEGCAQVKVYNFAVVSSVSTMELARIVFEALDYNPDMIISYSGFNDIDQPLAADPRPGYPFNYFIYESNPLLESNLKDYPLLPLLAYGSHLARVFAPGYFLKNFADLETLRRQSGYGTTAWQEAIAETYVSNLVKSDKIARAFGARFIAFFQPSLYFKDVPTPEERDHMKQKHARHARRLRQMILARARTAGEKEGLRFIDLSDFFKGKNETVFRDRVHIGHRQRPAIAREIYRHVLRLMEEDSHGDPCP